uniref:ABC transporter permease n=1 Tax=Syphacia muris TaxID=451379 RepID=A0A0N5AVD4_9BILA
MFSNASFVERLSEAFLASEAAKLSQIKILFVFTAIMRFVRSFLLLLTSMALILQASAGIFRPQIESKIFGQSPSNVYGYSANGDFEYGIDKRANAEMIRFFNQLSHLEPYQLVPILVVP